MKCRRKGCECEGNVDARALSLQAWTADDLGGWTRKGKTVTVSILPPNLRGSTDWQAWDDGALIASGNTRGNTADESERACVDDLLCSEGL